ncbi:MAG: DUF5011 domain-containing protein [Paenibacillaceae bacterium]|nr:DUF5011 domain-containing protein [Paenibacillaceae bacterium]
MQLNRDAAIGSGAWSLQFGARFADLMTPAQNVAERGVVFIVYAAGKRYQIAFNDRDKVVALTSGTGAYIRQQAAMPVDNRIHEWEIAYNGGRNVSVKLDGAVVASFDDISFATTHADGVTVANSPLDWQAGTNEAYLDSVRLTKRATADGTVLLEDDAANMKQAGWSLRIPAENGLYITDTGQTLGNPNQAAMKPVAPGQYLFYGDQTASFAGKYTSLAKSFNIGPAAWTIEFAARFVDLMTPALYPAERGFGFLVYANQKRYQLLFNDTNKLLALTNASTSEYIRKEVAMPTDAAFHQWAITYDGINTVMVLLDGAKVASFSNIALSAPGKADGLTIVNTPLDWQSGTNEVYLDFIRMWKGAIADPNVAINDDATSFAVTGWTADTPATGAYFTDSGRTNGSVPGMKTIEAGRYLTYADSSASGAATIRQPVALGAGVWAAEFDARIDRLAVPAASAPEVGLRTDIVAGGMRYRVIIGGADKLLVANAQGGYESLDVALPTDGLFHTWGIARDEHGRIIVTLDGGKLGWWTGAGIPTAESDSFAIGNDAVGALSGANEAAFDRIRLTRNELPEWTQFKPLITGVTVLPTSQTAQIDAIVSVADADPLWYASGALTVQSAVYQGDTAVYNGTQAVQGPAVALRLNAGNETGDMKMKLRLVNGGGAVRNEVTQNIEVYRAVYGLNPGQTATAVPGEVRLFTAMDETTDNAGNPTPLAEWHQSTFTYDGTNEGGILLEHADGSGSWQLPVQLHGWYGVYIGYVTGTEGFAVTDGVYRQDVTIPVVGPVPSVPVDPYGSKAIAEVFALASDFAGGTVSVAPLTGNKARIAYVKLIGLTSDEIATYTRPDEGAAGKRVIYNNDGSSDFYSGLYADEQTLVDNAVNIFAGQDVDSLYWGLGTTMLLLRNSQYAGMPFAGLTPAQEALMADGDKQIRDTIVGMLNSGKDPLTIVAGRARQLGLHPFASMRMEAFYKQDQFPWLNGNLYGEYAGKGYLQKTVDGFNDFRMSYAYPEFRQYVIHVLQEAAAVTDAAGVPLIDGVELDYGRYPYVLGYEPDLTNAYKAQYGILPQQETTQTGLARWYRFKAEVMTDFMRDVRQQLPGKLISVRIPYDEYEKDGLDVATWVREGLIDRLVPSVIGHEDFFGGLNVFRDMTAGTNVQLYGGITSSLAGHELTKQEEDLRKRGIPISAGFTAVSRQQYLLRAHQFYEAGYDGVYIFNNWNGGQSILGALGDRVKVDRWYKLAYPAEWVQNLVTVAPPQLTVTGLRPIGGAALRIEEGTVYADAGATAMDGAGADISGRIVSDAQAVDTHTPGVYTVTYRVAGADGRDAVAPAKRTVTVAPHRVSAQGSADGSGAIVVDGARGGVELKLYDASGAVVRTGLADGTGMQQFLSVPFGGGYTVTQTAYGAESDRSVAVDVTTSVHAMRGLVGQFRDSGNIVAAFADELDYRLMIIAALLGQDASAQAAAYMEDFVAHIGDPAVLQQRLIAAEATESLKASARALLRQWTP